MGSTKELSGLSSVLAPNSEVVEIGDETDCCYYLETGATPPRLTAHDEAVVDRLRSMLAQETDPSYIPCDYLSASAQRRRRRRARKQQADERSQGFQGHAAHREQQQQQDVDRTCRTKMIQWMYQVVDYCEFTRESVAVASSHLDRFLSAAASSDADFSSSTTVESTRAASPLSDRKTYQLAAMTALYVSVKTTEPVVITTEILSEVSQGVYSESEIVDMERRMLDALGWRVSSPTPLDFASHFLELLLPSSVFNDDDEATLLRGEILDLVRYQIELSVADYELSVKRRPSSVALAAIRNVLAIMSESGRLSPSGVAGYLELVRSSTGMDDPLRPEIEGVMERLARTLRLSGSPALATSSDDDHRRKGEQGVEVSDATVAKAQVSTGETKTMSPVCVSSSCQEGDVLSH